MSEFFYFSEFPNCILLGPLPFLGGFITSMTHNGTKAIIEKDFITLQFAVPRQEKAAIGNGINGRNESETLPFQLLVEVTSLSLLNMSRIYVVRNVQDSACIL